VNDNRPKKLLYIVQYQSTTLAEQ